MAHFFVAILDQDYPGAEITDTLIIVTTGYLAQLEFIGLHIAIQRCATQATKTDQPNLTDIDREELENLNQELPLLYTAISSAFLAGRIDGEVTFAPFLDRLSWAAVSEKPAEWWTGAVLFTLLHEIGHYEGQSKQFAGLQAEEHFCDRLAIQQMLPVGVADNDTLARRYIGFWAFAGVVLTFFTNRWLIDYHLGTVKAHPATSRRTERILDVLSASGHLADLKANLRKHWHLVRSVARHSEAAKTESQAGLHVAVQLKLERYHEIADRIDCLLEGQTSSDEIDVWRVAQLLSTNNGDGAEAKARRSLEHCQRNGAAEGVAFWQRVEVAIGELRKTEPMGRMH